VQCECVCDVVALWSVDDEPGEQDEADSGVGGAEPPGGAGPAAVHGLLRGGDQLARRVQLHGRVELAHDALRLVQHDLPGLVWRPGDAQCVPGVRAGLLLQRHHDAGLEWHHPAQHHHPGARPGRPQLPHGRHQSLRWQAPVRLLLHQKNHPRPPRTGLLPLPDLVQWRRVCHARRLPHELSHKHQTLLASHSSGCTNSSHLLQSSTLRTSPGCVHFHLLPPFFGLYCKGEISATYLPMALRELYSI
jgi:hypothetical protein